MMKKLFLFCAFLWCGWQIVTAQEVYNYLENGCDNGIIREQGIAYYERHGVGYFVYLPSINCSTIVYQVQIPDNWSIRDFRVLSNIVYFCGTNTITKTALLGYFDISNLQSGTGNIVFFHDNTISNQLSILNRISVTNSMGYVSLMAIGRRNVGLNPNKVGADKVVYIENYQTMTEYICSPKDNDEVFWDVVTTVGHFVTAGTRGIGSSDLVLRSAVIGAPIATFQAELSNGKLYSCSNNFATGVRAASLDGDSVAFAVYCDSSSLSWMQVFTIGAHTKQIQYNQYSGMRFSTPVMRTIPPRDMAYLYDSKTLMVIDTVPSYNTIKQCVIMIDPYPANAYFPPFYSLVDNNALGNMYNMYNSLVRVSVGSGMMAAGASWMLLNLTSLPNAVHTNGCIVSYINDYFCTNTPNNNDFYGMDFGEELKRNMSSDTIVVVPKMFSIGCTPMTSDTVYIDADAWNNDFIK